MLEALGDIISALTHQSEEPRLSHGCVVGDVLVRKDTYFSLLQANIAAAHCSQSSGRYLLVGNCIFFGHSSIAVSICISVGCAVAPVAACDARRISMRRLPSMHCLWLPMQSHQLPWALPS